MFVVFSSGHHRCFRRCISAIVVAVCLTANAEGHVEDEVAEHMASDVSSQLERLHEELRELRGWATDREAELRDVRQRQQALEARLDECGCGNQEVPNHDQLHSVADPESEEYGSDDVDQTRDDSSGWRSYVLNVNIQDEDWVKEVFFGGKPWLVHCIDKQAAVKQEVPDVFAAAAYELKSLATFGTLHCWERLASGKTLAQRFNLPKPPVTFGVANGDPPYVLNLHDVVRPSELKQQVDMYLAVQVTEVDNLARFKALCSKRKACLVVYFQTLENTVAATQMLVPLLNERRAVRAVAVDATVWKLRIDDRLASSKPVVGSKRANLLCLARTDSGRAGAFLKAGDQLELDVVARFLELCEEGRGPGLMSLSETPWISHHSASRPRSRPASKPAPRSRKRSKREDDEL